MTREIVMEPDGDERKMSVPIICHEGEVDSAENKLFQRRKLLRESEGIQLNTLHPITHGRSCSFRNRPRPKLLNVDSDRQRRNSLPSPSANLLSVSFDGLHQHRTEPPLQRVRSFKTTPKGGVVNRGDSFKRSTNSVHSQGSVIVSDNTGHPRSRSQSRQRIDSNNSKGSNSENSEVSSTGPTVYKVAILGEKGVGKSSLTNQFMTSEFVAFDNDHEDETETERNVTVLLNSEESTLNIVNKPMDAQELADQCFDAFAVVFSITDRTSYQSAVDRLYSLRYESLAENVPTILIANKIDLVRKRKITKEEARAVAKQYCCKYIETSAALNHHVDELLVGLLSQIRLRKTPGMVMEPPKFDSPRDKLAKCALPGPKRLLNFIFKKPSCKTAMHECEDLFS